MKISFAAPSPPKTGALIVGVLAKGVLTAAAADLDKATDGALKRAIEASGGRFTGKKNQLLDVLAPQGLPNQRVLLVGLGETKELGSNDLEEAAGTAVGHLTASGVTEAAILLGEDKDLPGAAERAARYALGATLRSYRFDKYKTTEAADKKPSLKKLSIHLKDAAGARRAWVPLEALAQGVFHTRDVVSEPANVIFPKSFAAEAQKLTELGVKVTALGVKEMTKLGMGALLGVGQGSTQESQLVVLEWQGLAKPSKEGPLAICGKGVTFDTGGISIKPAAGMEDMKWDMGGAGVVLGLIEALARRKAKVHVVGLCGLVENMPSGTAQRPGDIVKSMSGQTIEVINTDAEGRLVLGDVLWYAQETYAPRLIIDLATLTGAIMIALGTLHAGLFSNDDALAEKLLAAGKATGEKLWRMPLGEEYDRIIDSDAADMKNVGNRYGGSITAAQFIQRFVKKGTPWAHLDIAGVTWSDKAKGTVPKGATAFGLRLLERMIAEHYERHGR
ncbi:MAG TPA: leucyl aminopeptidase [Kiloniellales bacterium]|nr:leucyl aminopeptidase [Kiloniellales bacterium]